jgi:hypothetical protein
VRSLSAEEVRELDRGLELLEKVFALKGAKE